MRKTVVRATALAITLLGFAVSSKAQTSPPAPVEATPTPTPTPMIVTGFVTTRDDGLSVPGAIVTIDSLKLSTFSEMHGRYTLELPADTKPGTPFEVRVHSSGLLPQIFLFHAIAGTVSHDFALTLTYAEQVTVGSRAMGATGEAAVPVDLITSKQIEMTGASETMQVIQRLAPSFNFPRPTISDGSASVRPASLRGLGPDQVLVLVNGKRRHTTALVHVNGTMGRGSTGADLNAIPVSAIERIEILRDGAAAQYGSDAIAGVINIVLKSGSSEATASMRGGFTKTGQGVNDSTIDGGQFDTGINKGFKLGQGWVNVTGEFRDRNRTNRAGVDPRDQIVVGDAGRNAVAQPNHWVGDPETVDYLTFVNAQVPKGESSFIYAYGGFSKRDATGPGFFRRALQFTQNWSQIYPQGFLPLIGTAVVDGSGTIGVRGMKKNWYWDGSIQAGRNSMDFNITNTLNASLGPTSKTEFYAGSFVGTQLLANLDLSREVDIGLAGPLNVAFGGEFRREGYRLIAGEPDSYRDGGVPASNGAIAIPGAQVFPGFRPSNAVDVSRNNSAVYVDLEGDVAPRFRVGVAGRFEDYSDFGSTVDGKLTLRLKANDKVVLRGGASTGFRAPSLAQSNFSAVSTNFIAVPGQGTVAVEVGTFAVNNPVSRALGAADLKPEDSVHFSAGMAFTPRESFDFTADYYSIKIDDRIVLSGNFTGGSITSLLAPFGATGARFFTNAINTRTQGVDLTANYRTSFSNGNTLRLFAGYNHNRTSIEGEVATPPQLVGLGNVLYDRVERGRTECGQPRNQARIIADLGQGGFSLNTNVGMYGGYCVKQLTASGADDQNFSKKWITDVEASYRYEKFLVAIGAQNLFDVYPEQVLAQLQPQGVRYSTTNTFGINGRFIYMRASVRF